MAATAGRAKVTQANAMDETVAAEAKADAAAKAMDEKADVEAKVAAEAKADAAAKKGTQRTKGAFYPLMGTTIITRKGIMGEYDEITTSILTGGEATFKSLKAKKLIEMA